MSRARTRPKTNRMLTTTQQQAGQGRQKRDERSEPERNARMRCREFAGAALVADFGIAGIRMPVRAELEIVGPPAEIAEQRLAGGDSVTLVAIAHRVLIESEWR